MRRKRAEARTQGISIPCLCRRAEGLAQVPRRNESQGEVFQKEYGKRQLPEESIQMLQKWDGSEMGGGVETESAGYLEGIVWQQMGS